MPESELWIINLRAFFSGPHGGGLKRSAMVWREMVDPPSCVHAASPIVRYTQLHRLEAVRLTRHGNYSAEGNDQCNFAEECI